MIALKIPAIEIKNLMHQLLKEEAFDFFELREVGIRSFVRFDIHGLLHTDDSATSETAGMPRKYALWRDIRPYIFQIVKGAKRPHGMRFVFALPYEKMTEIAPLAAALFLNMIFENGELLATTGLTQKEFSLDKSLDAVWDDYIRRFFKERRIAFIE